MFLSRGWRVGGLGGGGLKNWNLQNGLKHWEIQNFLTSDNSFVHCQMLSKLQLWPLFWPTYQYPNYTHPLGCNSRCLPKMQAFAVMETVVRRQVTSSEPHQWFWKFGQHSLFLQQNTFSETQLQEMQERLSGALGPNPHWTQPQLSPVDSNVCLTPYLFDVPRCEIKAQSKIDWQFCKLICFSSCSFHCVCCSINSLWGKN